MVHNALDTSAGQQQRLAEANQLYQQYGKPLEHEHRGEYIAVSKDGKTLLGNDLLTLTKEAVAQLGPGNYIFKVGERAVGKWLSLWR